MISNPVKKDIVIVGAGPSGSQLAFGLARLGHEVVVLDSKTAAGERICCTGIISKRCLDSFAIDKNLILRPANSAKFVAPSGKWFRLWRDEDVAYILDRPALDLALVNRAREAGAECLFSAQVFDIQLSAHGVQVKANYLGEVRVIEAQAAVLATGFGSPWPRKLGLGAIRSFIVGAQAKVDTTGVDETEVYFNQALAPSGFAWLVPTTDGRGLAGLLTYRRPELCLKTLLSRLQVEGKVASAGTEIGFGTIPLRPLARTYHDRILVVGEAAGQVKPTTGGGIYYCLLCADIAVDSLHQAFLANDFSSSRLSLYDKRWRARLNRELNTSYWARRFYERLSNRHIERIFKIMRSNGTPELMTGWKEFSFDGHRALILKVLKHLVATAPLQTVKALLKW